MLFIIGYGRCVKVNVSAVFQCIKTFIKLRIKAVAVNEIIIRTAFCKSAKKLRCGVFRIVPAAVEKYRYIKFCRKVINR